jgi:hypothetical protein
MTASNIDRDRGKCRDRAMACYPKLRAQRLEGEARRKRRDEEEDGGAEQEKRIVIERLRSKQLETQQRMW